MPIGSRSVDACDVMHDEANLASILGIGDLPFLIGEGTRRGGQCVSSLFETFGKRMRTLTDRRRTIRLDFRRARHVVGHRRIGLSRRVIARHIP